MGKTRKLRKTRKHLKRKIRKTRKHKGGGVRGLDFWNNGKRRAEAAAEAAAAEKATKEATAAAENKKY